MTNNKGTLGPVTSTERIRSLDVLRGVALLGILLLNIAGFGLVFMSYMDPTVQGGAEGKNLFVWVVNNIFFEGTMRALFSMLFGVGMVLMTSRMISRGGGIETADIYYRRTIWLLIFGLVHAYLILWFGDILFAYGLWGLFLFPFRNTHPKKLIIAVAVLVLIGVCLQYIKYEQSLEYHEQYLVSQEYAEDDEIPEDIKNGKEAWKGMMAEMKPDEESIEKDTEAMHKGYVDLVLHLAPVNRMVQTTFNYDYNPWDVLAMMLLGIALFKLGVITGELKNKTYALMILVGYGIGIPINYYETTLLLENNFSIPAFFESGLTYPFGRIAMSFGHIGVVMIFCKSGILSFLRNSLAAVGRMALTNYIMQSVICAFIFTGIGFSLFGKLQRYQLYYVVFSIWLFQMIFSPLWLKYFRFGPLEWLWRTLTYKKIQPFRRRNLQNNPGLTKQQ